MRLDTTTASGLVTAQGAGALNLNLAFLGGRAIAPFDFVRQQRCTRPVRGGYTFVGSDEFHTGRARHRVGTDRPVWCGAPPNFTASTLLDPTTIQAELAIDYGSGTSAPFYHLQ